MTDTSGGRLAPALGVGAIIGKSFSILFGNLFAVILMALLPAVIGLIISGPLVGWNVAVGLADPTFVGAGSVLAFVLSMLVDFVVYAISTGLLVQLAYDASLRRPLQFNRYVSRALSAAVPIGVLGLVVGILTALAAIAFIIPGLWVYAVFSVVAPVVVIERAGFGGMGRSASLTKDYRWPIVGTLFIMIVFAFLIGFTGAFIIGVLDGGLIVSAVLFSIVSAFTSGLFGISVALIYARLREIKEGVSVDQIASVFD